MKMIILKKIRILKSQLAVLQHFLYSHLSFRSSKKQSATWAEVPLNRKSKRLSRVQTKDNIRQRLPNVRVDVQMIENASLCISLNFHDGPTPMRAKRSLLSRRSSFHGQKQNVRFIGIPTGNFPAATCLKLLHVSAPLLRTCRVCRIHRNVCNRSRARSKRGSIRSRPLIFSRARKIDWPIGSPGISFNRLTAKRDRITGQSMAGIKHSFARTIRPACLRFVDNKSMSGARAMVLQMAPSPYQSFLLLDKDRYKSSSYLSSY